MLAGPLLDRTYHSNNTASMQTEEHATFKYAVFDQFAQIGRAVAHPHRLSILDVLAQAPRSVEALAAEVHLPVANTSHHLQVLRGAGLVSVRQEGQHRWYSLASEEVVSLWRVLVRVGERHLAEIDRIVGRHLPDRAADGQVPGCELLPRLATTDVLVLDVRPHEEYRNGHVDGAHSVPLATLAEHLESLPRDKELVVYCRGRYCVFADEAVAVLRRHGFRARRLQEGFLDWRQAGFPVDDRNPPSQGSAGI